MVGAELLVDNAATHDRDRVGWRALADAAQAVRVPAWYADALCRAYPAEWWFPTKENPTTASAREVCQQCAVADECADASIDEPAGVWASRSPRQRVTLRRDAA